MKTFQVEKKNPREFFQFQIDEKKSKYRLKIPKKFLFLHWAEVLKLVSFKECWKIAPKHEKMQKSALKISENLKIVVKFLNKLYLKLERDKVYDIGLKDLN